MLYKNYKQVAIIHLNSVDADSVVAGVAVPIQLINTVFNTEYIFNVNIPYKFTKQTKMSLVSFNLKYYQDWLAYNGNSAKVGGLYIKNLHKSNIYHKKKSNGLLLLNEYFGGNVEYYNQDIINNSIDITNNTSFLEGNQIKIFLDTQIIDDGANTISGFPNNGEWSIKLYIFEEELVENKPNSVDDKTVNYSRPAIY